MILPNGSPNLETFEELCIQPTIRKIPDSSKNHILHNNFENFRNNSLVKSRRKGLEANLNLQTQWYLVVVFRT